MKRLLALLFSIYFGMPLCTHEPKIDQHIHDIVSMTFPFLANENISVKPLQGGLSSASLYRVEANDKIYVLRILQSQSLNDQDILELFCLTEAAKQGLSPQVYAISSDNRMVLMEYIDGKTLSIEQANLSDNVRKIAKILREVHQIPEQGIAGESLLSKAMRCAPFVLNDHLASANDIEDSYELVKNYTQALEQYEYTKVRVHGDLNPRNIFLADDRILLIDWAETTIEDPFYDLAYFSLKAGYPKKNEWLLLASYLERHPTENECERFELHKKILHAFWSLTDLYLAKMELNQHPEQAINTKNILKDWETYQRIFAEPLEELSAQFFYDLSRLNFQLAK